MLIHATRVAGNSTFGTRKDESYTNRAKILQAKTKTKDQDCKTSVCPRFYLEIYSRIKRLYTFYVLCLKTILLLSCLHLVRERKKKIINNHGDVY